MFFQAKYIQAPSGCFGKIPLHIYAVLGGLLKISISTQRTLGFSEKLAVQLRACTSASVTVSSLQLLSNVVLKALAYSFPLKSWLQIFQSCGSMKVHFLKQCFLKTLRLPQISLSFLNLMLTEKLNSIKTIKLLKKYPN